MKAHIKEHPAWFHRFDAVWTPTVLLLDASSAAERQRTEGYLPNEDFVAQLENGLGRIAFVHKQWTEAESRYGEVVRRFPRTTAAPEAVYWRGVAEYKRTNDHTVLGRVEQELKKNYPDSVWTRKALPWAH